jgi:hypothetical protein
MARMRKIKQAAALTMAAGVLVIPAKHQPSDQMIEASSAGESNLQRTPMKHRKTNKPSVYRPGTMGWKAPTTTTTIPQPTTTTTVPPTTTTTTAPVETRKPVERKESQEDTSSSNAIPESVSDCESGGDYNAENPSSSASGKYQMIDGTFQGTEAGAASGYESASDAPPSVQDAAAAEVWDNGRGAHNWKACL